MKGVLPLVFVLMIMVIVILGYYNLKQQSTIELLNEEIFEQHIQFYKSNFDVISIEELESLSKSTSKFNQKFAIISFDDGYIDNYELAYPILKSYQTPAIFFIATDFIDKEVLPWWDEIAFLLRQSCGKTYRLLNTGKSFTLQKATIDRTIQRIMSAAKVLEHHSIEEVLSDVREQFHEAKMMAEENKQQLFMSWNQVKEMAVSGMEIGSHTISHRILSQLSLSQQEHEIVTSKQVIESRISKPVHSIAYPVGRYYCYNQSSFTYAQQAGYLIGFNNEPGYHRSISNEFDINRFCVSNNNFDFVKFECCFK